jgi:hypothetical protein
MQLKDEFFKSSFFLIAFCIGKRGGLRTNDVTTESSPDLWHTRASDVESNRGKGGKHSYALHVVCVFIHLGGGAHSHQLGR